jgi:GT2 family glycosyltransferase
MRDVLVSVVIVNRNLGHFLEDCLGALLSQEYPEFDVTVVDNGSTDGSPDWIASYHPDVQLMRFPDNCGFARAFNQGAVCTDGEFVLSLNPDVTVSPGFILEMVRAMGEDQRVGAVAPRLLRAADPTTLDSTGLLIDRRRRPRDRGQGETDRGQYDALPYVFGACAAAALYRRAMLDDLACDGQYFDEDFFSYYEDADLAWRSQLRDWRCVYARRAVAAHVRGWGDTLRKRGHAAKDASGPRLALRNRYLMTIKNDTLPGFLADLPRASAAELPRLAYAAIVAPAVLRGIGDLLRAWPLAVRKRRQIQNRRTAHPSAVRRWFVSPYDAASGWVRDR